MKKKFISIIWWYHHQIFWFHKEQNYHMLPIEVMKEHWYDCEIFSIGNTVDISADPNFIQETKIIYYKNLIQFLCYIRKHRNDILYANSLTLKTLIVWVLWKYTIFCPHSFPFWNSPLKKMIIFFLYRFFKKIRVNNTEELSKINKIRPNLWFICPLCVSGTFLNTDMSGRTWGVWIWNLTPIKNPFLLIQAWKIIKEKQMDFQITIIWEDRFLQSGKNFQDIIQEHQLEEIIIYVWVKSHTEIQKYLWKSMIYINTSISEWQCLWVYEWALAGNALCLQNIMSFPSVFQKNALYHDNPTELVENICKFLKDESLRKESIKNNQNYILQAYNYEEIKKKFYKEVYNFSTSVW